MGVIVGIFVAIIGFKVSEYRAEQAVLVEAPAVEEEVEELASAVSVPVDIHDERLTTVIAAQELSLQGLDNKRQRKVIDQVAASVILQSWLDNRT